MLPLLMVLLLLSSQVAPTVAVSTDRTWYAPREQVIVHISIDGPVGNWSDPPVWVWLYIDGPDLRNVYFLQLSFNELPCDVGWEIPTDALEGTYTVTVTWHHEYAETSFVVSGQPIPEFPIAMIPFLFAPVLAMVVLSLKWLTTRAQILFNFSVDRPCANA